MSQRAGIIDLGSNTTRLVIYEYEPGQWFNLTDEVREVVRLREGMGNTNVLRRASIDRSLNALHMFRTLCEVDGVKDITVVTTSAVRDAENRESFLARAEADTGWKLRILSGEEEGYYGALGAINSTGLREGFVVDMGGGSAQIIEVRNGLPGRCVSLPLGALRLTELFFETEEVSEEQVTALQDFVREQLSPFDWFRAGADDELVIIGGTIRNLAQIDQARCEYPLDSVHAYKFFSENLHAISDHLWRIPSEKRNTVPGLQADRADIIHAGALAYSVIFDYSGFDFATISRYGLREGVFCERFLSDRPQPIIDDLRRFSVFSLARTFAGNEVHSRHVAHLALRMFDDLSPIHELDAGYRDLLWAAGILHDIGTAIGYDYHHHHSSYIVLNHTLPGYTPRELALISLLCRYHRSKGKPKARGLISLLLPADKRALRILAGILRLSEYLERGRRRVIRDVRCHLGEGDKWVQIEALADGDAEMELWDAGRNIDVLERALKTQVELVAGVWHSGEPSAETLS
uniref:Exopolyphosphatase / guanosine-5'-triphosphate,3'-diphosphate pyrophosphatase n=1 Tax=Candidatus Kentrum sp. TUN TaxID=2126343 RepID=A0A451A6T7_9GAMM|nr:MAG: exopolyphosphatase / guanosine-5'-triphosphate,3'-diphosphate pyrophosphatase [Candidatus Kentron sp. TUN]VFK57439.1 MAG: exopolyphosphatase / guanosine-5'-triphosphate,3'-diphosphate pyrophosphatase [Candidatus Kentron sp. TUN]VFK61739.1 MAG: exopolyphosphatase / guanosine-5'-triphosphate,3'-diphosphate pyrophosphatase [Candidatus Kentron sp. TUN]